MALALARLDLHQEVDLSLWDGQGPQDLRLWDLQVQETPISLPPDKDLLVAPSSACRQVRHMVMGLATLCQDLSRHME